MSSSAGPSYLTFRSSVHTILFENLVFSISAISTKLDPVTYVGNLTSVHFILMNEQQAHRSFCYSLLLGQFQLKLFCCGKGLQNFA